MSANEEADIRNFDLRSFYQQFECAVYTNDPAFMSDVLQDFEKTFEYSELVVESNRERRIGSSPPSKRLTTLRVCVRFESDRTAFRPVRRRKAADTAAFIRRAGRR